MTRRHRPFDPWIFLTMLVLLLAPGCSRVVRGGFFTLSSGQTVSGNLWVPFGKVELQEGSQVTGSVIMLCCSLISNGKVDGDIFLTFGDLNLDSLSTVKGDVVLLSGYYQRTMGSMVNGSFTSSMTPGIYQTIISPFQICLAAVVVLSLAVIIILIALVRRKKRQNAGDILNTGSLEKSSF